MATVLGIGELLWDDFPDGRRPGGAPANFAYHAGLLDADAAVISRVGDDQAGRDLIAELELAEVDPILIQVDSSHPTGVSVIELDAGEPSYHVPPAAWDHIVATVDTLDTIRAADALYFGTIAQRHEDSRTAITQCLQAAREGDVLVVFDINLRQDFYNTEIIQASLAAADLVKLNADEVTTVAALLNLPAELLEFAKALQLGFGIRCVCITRGSDGCFLVDGDETADIAGVEIELVDAVGAGDAFTAALVMGTLEELPLETRGEIANAVGALVASRAGAMPDIRAELEVMFGVEE